MLTARNTMVVGFVMCLGGGGVALGEAATGARGGRATAALDGSGEVQQVATAQLMIQASYTGIVYFDEKQSPLDGAVVRCPATATVDTRSKQSSVSGYCTFTTQDGSEAYSQWKCSGNKGSCEGELTITGGTGKLAGITGGGRMMWRAALPETAMSMNKGGVVRNAMGLLVWPSFTYELPSR